jgi:hypothetical protein
LLGDGSSRYASAAESADGRRPVTRGLGIEHYADSTAYSLHAPGTPLSLCSPRSSNENPYIFTDDDNPALA